MMGLRAQACTAPGAIDKTAVNAAAWNAMLACD